MTSIQVRLFFPLFVWSGASSADVLAPSSVNDASVSTPLVD